MAAIVSIDILIFIFYIKWLSKVQTAGFKKALSL